MARPGAEKIELDPVLDYRSNVCVVRCVPGVFCAWQPPFLVAWGSRDAHFIPAGALAYKRDLPKAQVHLLDAGHFALEMHAQEIGRLILEFLGRLP